ncbi:MAG TPA: HEAT repeat domain-containing protein, partial [Verrucomicrobiae bacterium]|nr:HEAT repeat domain-containing protein [Verrucomicrobiae bacterium]
MLLLVLVIFAGSVFLQPEPTYQGKRLGEYLDELTKRRAPELDDQTANAIYHFGPRAVPYLRQALCRKKSFKNKLLVFLHAKLPKALERHLPAAPDSFYYQRLSIAAAQCLSLFGPVARPAMPELLDCFNEPGTINFAYYAVQQIGPKPEDLPRLLVFLKGANFGAPGYAAELIGEIGVTNAEILAALIDRAQATDISVRWQAIFTLGDLGEKAKSAVPILTKNLDDPNAAIRIASAEALWRIRGKKDPPVALVMKLLGEENKLAWSILAARPRWDSMDFHERYLMYISILAKDIGPDAKPAVPLLRQAETNLPDWKCFYLADALWSIARDTNKLGDICQDVLAIPDFG